LIGVEAVLRALADESRRTLLQALANGEATAGELVALLPIARPAPPGTCGCCGRRVWSRFASRRSGASTASARSLTADGGQTILVIETHGMPLDKIAFYGAGWQIHAENLATYLAGREPGATEARWDELVPRYQELATTIG
jgi:hypothetical protein